jgi:hypothetical protein
MSSSRASSEAPAISFFRQLLEVGEAGLEVGADQLVHEQAEPAVDRIAAHVALHQPDDARAARLGLQTQFAAAGVEVVDAQLVGDAPAGLGRRDQHAPVALAVAGPVPGRARAQRGPAGLDLHLRVAAVPDAPALPTVAGVQVRVDLFSRRVHQQASFDPVAGLEQPTADDEQGQQADQHGADPFQCELHVFFSPLGFLTGRRQPSM